jgi:hypothetical protein
MTGQGGTLMLTQGSAVAHCQSRPGGWLIQRRAGSRLK